MENSNENTKTINDGGYAFACFKGNDYLSQKGMTLRDYFAAAALTGILSDPEKTKESNALSAKQNDDAYLTKLNSALAYCYADAMLIAREKEVQGV